MHVGLIALLCLIAWYVIGCGVLAAVDKREELFRWASQAPSELLYVLVVLSWPVVVWHYYRR
jgi:hypothetical protein